MQEVILSRAWTEHLFVLTVSGSRLGIESYGFTKNVAVHVEYEMQTQESTLTFFKQEFDVAALENGMISKVNWHGSLR